jgi:LmbE family N-acetylglucosaminyl deacetylase
MSRRHQNSSRAAVAIVAAHPDDEVLGCGGTAARWAAEGRAVHVLLLADGEGARAAGSGSSVPRAKLAARAAAARRAGAILRCASVELLGFPDNRMDGTELLDVVQAIEAFIARRRPGTVLTHHAGDVNIDHRIVHDAVIAACRPQPRHCVRELMFFETPSASEWRPPGSAPTFTPNYFVDITMTLKTKLAALRAYRSELRPWPHPRSLKAIEALAHWRGATVGFEAAEAFMAGRVLL